MTRLRKRMLEELQRRNYSPNTIRPYLYAVEDFARFFDKSPDKSLYATGMRREELSRLKLTDVDSQRMVIHVRQGKGNKDRDVTLSPRLLEVLRALLEMEKTQGLFVSQLPRQATRTTNQCKDRLVCRPRSRSASGH